MELGRALGARGRGGGKEGNEWPTGGVGQLEVEERAPEPRDLQNLSSQTWHRSSPRRVLV